MSEGVYIDQEITLSIKEANGQFTNDKYDKIVKQFGLELINEDLLNRFIKVTGHQPHRLLRRGIFFAHRHLKEILDDYEAGKKIFIYTGRGPTSEALHLGHIIPIEFTAWLQKVFNAFVVIQIADDEKYWFKDVEFSHVYKLGFKNAKDIIAFGFNPDTTFIFSNRDFSRNIHYQTVIANIMKYTKINDVQHIFGIESSANIGQLIWPVYQTAAAFSESFKDIFKTNRLKCLVAYAIDQDPYFRLARDVAPKLGFDKPCSLICQFLPALEGDHKMSSSTNNTSTTIFLTDDPTSVKKKIKRYAFSGGKDTIELHRQFGGNPDIDIAFQWLRYFMEDDYKLNEIEKSYRSGKLLSGELKTITADLISSILIEHKTTKECITDELLYKFYDIDSKKHLFAA